METPLTAHTSHRYDAELSGIRSRVLAMGGLVEQQLTDGLTALFTGDQELGEKVVNTDYQVNRMEVGIDEECSRILARRQPAARDLRLVVAIIKTITDLERIGDQAERVGSMATRLVDSGESCNSLVDMRHMAERVKNMLRGALDAFARMDPEAAANTAALDIEIDREYESLMRQLITFMMEDPRTITCSLHVMWAARALERIGDHSRNICEYVIYLVRGKDVRHTSLEQMMEEARAES